MGFEYKPRVFADIRNQVLELIRKQYPDVYEKLNLEETSLLSLLINVQSFLTETELYYLSQSLKECFISTAVQEEGILFHAYSVGYQPEFAVPAGGVAELVIPVQNLNTGERLLSRFAFDIDENTELFGNSLDGTRVVSYKPSYKYQIRFDGLNGIVYRFDVNGNQDVVNYRRLTYNFGGALFDCIAVPIEVKQINQITEIDEIIGETKVYDFYSIQLPLQLDEIKKVSTIKVYVNGEDAVYKPIVLLFEPDQYSFTIRFGEVPSILLSNGTFGKKVLSGSNVKIIIEKTDGSEGGIRENSLVFRTTPINLYEGDTLNQYAFLHPVFANGYDAEDPESIRRNTIRTLRTNERMVTQQDYNDLISRDFPDVYSFAISRETDLNVNEAAVYLGIVKTIDKDKNDIDFFKTDTKALILTVNELNNADYVKRIGGRYVIPSGVIYQEDTSVHYSGHHCRIQDVLDLNNLPADCTGLWAPLFTYEIDLTTNQIRSIFNPVNYSYTASIIKNEAVYQGMIITTEISPLTVNLVVTPTSLDYEVTLTVTLTFGGNLSNFNLLTSNPVESWLYVSLNDLVNSLSIDFNASTTLSILSVTSNSIVVKCTNKIPYGSLSPQTYNFDAYVQFKLPAESGFTHVIAQGHYRGVNFKYDFSNYSAAKLQYVSQDRCVTDYNYQSDDYIIIHDIPVYSLYELKETTPESLTLNLFKVFEEIALYTDQRSILTVKNNVLLARTFGFSYVYRYITNDHTALVKLPLEIELNVKLDPEVDTLTTASTIQENVKFYINETAGFFSYISRMKIFRIISDVEGVLSAEVISPASDLIFKIPSIESLTVCEFRAFVPEIYFTKNNLITVNVT